MTWLDEEKIARALEAKGRPIAAYLTRHGATTRGRGGDSNPSRSAP